MALSRLTENGQKMSSTATSTSAIWKKSENLMKINLCIMQITQTELTSAWVIFSLYINRHIKMSRKVVFNHFINPHFRLFVKGIVYFNGKCIF